MRRFDRIDRGVSAILAHRVRRVIRRAIWQIRPRMIPTLQMMFLHSLGAAPYDVRSDLIPPTDVQFDSRIRS